MTKLSEAGVVDIKWEEDEDGNVFASGLQDYEIDSNNELAIFQGDKCMRVHECQDLCHAVSMVYNHEAIMRWHIKMGKTWRGHKINERGWQI